MPLAYLVREENFSMVNTQIKIVVGHGGYADALQASTAQHTINWWDTTDTNAVVCTECFAAVQLRMYLCKIAGVDVDNHKVFPIVSDDHKHQGDQILIGNQKTNSEIRRLNNSSYNTTIAELSPEGCHVASVTHDNHTKVLIGGLDRVGTLYGVYAYLTHLGFRWYGQGDAETIIPDTITLLGCNLVETPSFITRGVYSECIDDSNSDFIQWLTCNRINFVRLENVLDPHELKKRGIHICVGGHSILHDYLNPQVYRKDHPDWYGYVEGTRNHTMGDGSGEGFGVNYCTSNKEATVQLCNNIIEDLAYGNLKEVDYLNFWLLDNGRWCECDACTETGNYSYRLMLLVYQLDKMIKDTTAIKRTVKILFPAYHETLEPPNKPLPSDFDYHTCIVSYFPIERCYVHYIDDTNCTETNVDLIQTYSRWTTAQPRVYQGSVLVGEYYNVSAFASCHIPTMNMMKHDIPYYYQTNTRHMHYMHVTDTDWGGLRVTNYLFANLLWNVHGDYDALMQEYYTLFYDDVSATMQEFYTQLEVAMQNAKALKHYQYADGVRHQLATKLNHDEASLFPLKHLQYDNQLDDKNAGISVVETIELVKKCRICIDAALIQSKNPKVITRLMADEARFTYTENMFHFIYYMIRIHKAEKQGCDHIARLSFQKASEYAQKLELYQVYNKRIPRFTQFDNGLAASWCLPAYMRYKNRYQGGV